MILTRDHPTRSRPHPRRRRDEHGSTSIQMVLLMPALFALMFLGMQAALHYHARTLAIAAAQEGARAAGAQGGTKSEGMTTATGYLAATAGDSLTVTGVTGSRTATTATITVRGTALSVLPGWAPTITQSASVPVERTTR